MRIYNSLAGCLIFLLTVFILFCFLGSESEARLIIRYSKKKSNWEIDFTFDSGPCWYYRRSGFYSGYWGGWSSGHIPISCWWGSSWGFYSYPRYYVVAPECDCGAPVYLKKSGRGRDYDLAYYQAAMARRQSELGMDVHRARVEFDENLDRGHTLFRRGKYREAADAYKEAILIDESSGLPFIFFGQALLACGDYIYASKAIRRGLGLVKNIESLTPPLKELFDSSASYERCRESLSALHLLDSDDTAVAFLMGWVLYWEGDREKAVSLFQEVLRRSPSWEELRILIPR